MNPKLNTVADLLARCTEYGQCLIWPGATTRQGTPQARLNGDMVSVKRAVYAAEKGLTLDDIDGLFVWSTCLDQLCVCGKHLTAGTRLQMLRWRAYRGLAKHAPNTIAKMTRAARARPGAVLSIAMVREIRQSGEGSGALSARLGIKRERVTRVRSGAVWAEQVKGASVFAQGRP